MTSIGASSGAVFATRPKAASQETAKSATASHWPEVGEMAAWRAAAESMWNCAAAWSGSARYVAMRWST